jgi:uncharacterized protein YcbX
MHVSGLFVYPVKSLRGFAVTAAALDELGVVGDRRFLVIDGTGNFLTQRTAPQMARIDAALTRDSLVLRADGAGSVAVPLQSPPAPQTHVVSVWRSHGLIVDECGDEAAAWLTEALGAAARLVRIGASFRRPVLRKPRYAAGVTPAAAELVEGRVVTFDRVNFADGYPFMAVGEASLADLNARLAARGEAWVPMDRFRPNLVISGSAPFAEDTWTRVRIGSLELRGAGPCGRCIVTTTDQRTGERGVEPLRTLATYRRDAHDPTNVNFGQNLVHETKSGTLRIGDPVVVVD